MQLVSLRTITPDVRACFASAFLIWFVLIAACALIAFPSQILEYYRVASLEIAVAGFSRIGLSAIIFVFSTSFVCFICILVLNITHYDPANALPRRIISRHRIQYVTASTAIALPFLSLSVGLKSAAILPVAGRGNRENLSTLEATFSDAVFDSTGVRADVSLNELLAADLPTAMMIGSYVSIFIAVALFLFVQLPAIRSFFLRIARLLAQNSLKCLIISLVIYLMFCSLLLVYAAELGLRVGTFGFLSLGIALFVTFLSTVAAFSRRAGYPFCFLFLMWPILISALGLNDNDKIAFSADMSKSITERQLDFNEYATERLNVIERSPYARSNSIPIYIVAAPGGGLYASYFASNFLTQATLIRPRFFNHLFAVSAVSGGALGSSIYFSLHHDGMGCETSTTRSPWSVSSSDQAIISPFYYLRHFHEKDLLAPLVGSFIFLDSLQAFIPYGMAELNRVNALEEAVRLAWKSAKSSAPNELSVLLNGRIIPKHLQKSNSDPLDCAIAAVQSGKSGAPALVYNVTSVSDGSQAFIAPFKMNGSLEVLSPKRVPIITGTLLSARFPYITPPGWFYDRKSQTTREYLVDGGYYENSGVATGLKILELLRAFRDRNERSDLQLRFVALVGPESTKTRMSGMLAELLAPIHAVGRSLEARGRAYVNSLRRRLPECKAGSTQLLGDCHMVIVLKDMFYRMPLGWDTSEISRLIIESQKGAHGKCERDQVRGTVNAKCFMDFLQRDFE